jgi:hypothetical protein
MYMIEALTRAIHMLSTSSSLKDVIGGSDPSAIMVPTMHAYTHVASTP